MKRVRVYKGDNSLLGEFLFNELNNHIYIPGLGFWIKPDDLELLGLRVEEIEEKPKKLYQWVAKSLVSKKYFIGDGLFPTKEEAQHFWNDYSAKIVGIAIHHPDGSVTWKEE